MVCLFLFVYLYCLGSFYVTLFILVYRKNTIKAGFKALTIGKVGDLSFYIIIAILIKDSITLLTIVTQVLIQDYITMITLTYCLLFTASSKSTQFGLHV